MKRARPDRTDIVTVGILGIAAIVFAVQVGVLFGRLPVPWPDEALFAEPALRLLHEGRLASPLVTGAAAGVAERTYWYPFGYFLLLSGAFALAGETLEVMRALSLVAAVGLLAIIFRLGRSLGIGRPAVAIAIGLLSLDPVFVRAALVGRPDVLALALIAASLLLDRDGRERSRIAGGAAAGFAAIVHPFGAIALLVLAARLARERSLRSLQVVGVSAVPLGVWAVYVFQDLPSFVDQLGLNFALHERPWSIVGVVSNILNQYPDQWALAILPAWLIGAVGLVTTVRRDRSAAPIPAAFALTSALTLSLQMWHPLYALPFMYLGIACFGETVRTTFRADGPPPVLRAISAAALLAIVVATVALDVDQFTSHVRIAATFRRSAYGEWTAAIASGMPAGSRVLIGGVPDPAWGLFRQDLRLVALQDDARSFGHFVDRLGAEIDYVVLTGSVSHRWLDLVQRSGGLDRRVVVDTGQHDAACEDWIPCGPLIATIFRVGH